MILSIYQIDMENKKSLTNFLKNYVVIMALMWTYSTIIAPSMVETLDTPRVLDMIIPCPLSEVPDECADHMSRVCNGCVEFLSGEDNVKLVLTPQCCDGFGSIYKDESCFWRWFYINQRTYELGKQILEICNIDRYNLTAISPSY